MSLGQIVSPTTNQRSRCPSRRLNDRALWGLLKRLTLEIALLLGAASPRNVPPLRTLQLLSRRLNTQSTPRIVIGWLTDAQSTLSTSLAREQVKGSPYFIDRRGKKFSHARNERCDSSAAWPLLPRVRTSQRKASGARWSEFSGENLGRGAE